MLFINPADENFGGILSRYTPIGVPIALGFLTAYLRKYGVSDIRVVDDEIAKITKESLKTSLEGLEKPYIIGITVLTSQAGRAYRLARMCREAAPDCIVIMGGIHCTALPQEPLETGVVDFVVRGEGEEVLRQLYFALRNGDDWRGIRGISYVDENGKIVNNPDGDLIQDLDDIPLFPYELFEHPKYDKGFLTGARGCPYKCTYCSQRLMTGLSYRYHSAERVVEVLSILINKYKQTKIQFYDDNFSVNRKRVFDLCDGIVAAGLHKKCEFSVQTRADNLYEEIMPALVRANFKAVGFGMETGVERIAQLINKGETVATHLEKVELCRKYGIHVSLFMIFGLPAETSADRDASFEVVRKAKVGYAKFNNLIPYPGTVLYDLAKKDGRVFIAPGWRNFNSTLSVTRSIFSPIPLPYVPEGTTEFELKRDIIRRNLQLIFTWKTILSVLRGEKGMGWVMLPEKWYLKPREIVEIAKTGLALLINLVFSSVPLWFGRIFCSFAKRDAVMPPPEDIKVTTRVFNRAPVPQVSQVLKAENRVPEPALSQG